MSNVQNLAAYLGIDPGQSGALAVIANDGTVETHDWPIEIAGLGPLLTSVLARYNVLGAAIEHVHSMPKQGVASSFNFGQNFGAWQAALAVRFVPYTLVTPRRWQKSMLDSSSGDTKTRSLSMARRLYPDAELHLKKHDGRADALHLARYAQQLFGGRK
jgi:Holliday junction resolvasome RuvABC endonuclease subunit